MLWLFCWAKTGMGSEDARVVAIDVFDQVFHFTFAHCEALIDHEYARKFRYSREDIDFAIEA
jgi:hypothetical protein